MFKLFCESKLSSSVGICFKICSIMKLISKGKYIKKNISKAIHYLTLAADQYNSSAQNFLGFVYYDNENIAQDINKSIHYFELAANQNNPQSLFNLGFIYYDGYYIKRDVKKAIHYFTLSSSLDYPRAQYFLGKIYINGIDCPKNINKGIDLLIESSNNGNIDACFAVGYFYHEGKYVNRDINTLMHYYKEASSFNNQYAKNNLGIIYKNGLGNEIPKNLGFAIEYFDEAISRFNDELSIYNLAHLYLYEDETKEKIDKSIELLTKLLKTSFFPARNLFCIALIIKNGCNFEKNYQNLLEIKISIYLMKIILEMILKQNFIIKSFFEEKYQQYKKIDFLYDFNTNKIQSNELNKQKSIQIDKKEYKEISQIFYDGFDINL